MKNIIKYVAVYCTLIAALAAAELDATETLIVNVDAVASTVAEPLKRINLSPAQHRYIFEPTDSPLGQPNVLSSLISRGKNTLREWIAFGYFFNTVVGCVSGLSDKDKCLRTILDCKNYVIISTNDVDHVYTTEVFIKQGTHYLSPYFVKQGTYYLSPSEYWIKELLKEVNLNKPICIHSLFSTTTHGMYVEQMLTTDGRVDVTIFESTPYCNFAFMIYGILNFKDLRKINTQEFQEYFTKIWSSEKREVKVHMQYCNEQLLNFTDCARFSIAKMFHSFLTQGSLKNKPLTSLQIYAYFKKLEEINYGFTKPVALIIKKKVSLIPGYFLRRIADYFLS